MDMSLLDWQHVLINLFENSKNPGRGKNVMLRPAKKGEVRQMVQNPEPERGPQ